MELQGGYNPAKNARINVRSGFQPLQYQVGRVFGQVSHQSGWNSSSKPGPPVGYPDLLLPLVKEQAMTDDKQWSIWKRLNSRWPVNKEYGIKDDISW